MKLSTRLRFQRFRSSVCLLVGISLICLVRLQAQNEGLYQWDTCAWHFGATDGFSGSVVYDISRDKEGYFWISTDAGVSKFDGHEFTNFNTGDGLTDNEVLGIKEDSRGRKWLMTMGGKPCFIQNDNIHHPKTDAYLAEMQSHGFVSAVFEDPDGNIYLGYFDGRSFKLNQNNQVTEISCNSLICRILGFGFSPKQGLFEVQNINDVLLIRGDSTHKFPVSNISLTGANNYPVKFLNRPDGSTIISWGRNLRFMDENFALTFYENVIPEGKILGIWNALNGDILVGTTIGAFRAKIEDGKLNLQQITNLRLPVFALFEDEESGLWIGTEHGLYLYPRHGCRKLALAPESSPPTSIAALSGGSILLGFEDGTLVQFDKNLNLVHTLSTSGDKIRNIFERNADEAWIRGSSGLYRWYKGSFIKIQVATPRSLAFSGGKKEKAAACFTNGWQEVDADKYDIVNFDNERLGTPKALGAPQCHCVKYIAGRKLIAATSEGIYLHWNQKKERLTGVETALGYSTVRVIEVGSEGNIWFGSAGSGVLVIKKDKMVRVTQANGLSSDQVSAIEPTFDGGCWVATDKGLQHIGFNGDLPVVSNPSGVSFWVRGKNTRSIALLNSMILAVADDQVFALATNAPAGQSASKVMIDRVRDESMQPIRNPQNHLRHGKSGISFHFVAISILNSQETLYRYRLLGLNDRWNTTRNREVRYEALPAGDYTFEVQVSDFKGGWAPIAARYPFAVLPAFWQTWWFILLCIVIVLSLLLGTFWLILRSSHRKNLLVQRAMAAEHKALITQMNPHFIFNSLNSIQYYYITNDLETANDYLVDFGLLIRAILENGRAQWISVGEEVRILDLYFKLERMRMRGNFRYQLLTYDLNVAKVKLPPMILQPIIENSIWHGLAKKEDEGLVLVEFFKEGKSLVIRVEDNGIGRKSAAEIKSTNSNKLQSLATSITKERLTLLSKEFPNQVAYDIEDKYDNQGLGAGTIVTIRLPYLEFTSNSETGHESNYH